MQKTRSPWTLLLLFIFQFQSAIPRKATPLLTHFCLSNTGLVTSSGPRKCWLLVDLLELHLKNAGRMLVHKCISVTTGVKVLKCVCVRICMCEANLNEASTSEHSNRSCGFFPFFTPHGLTWMGGKLMLLSPL